jgi:two-component system chemotaxis response regulator CheB
VEALKKSRAALPRRVRPVEEDLVKGHKVIVIGASMGGPRALEILFASLPRDLPASFLIVQHIPYEFSLTFAKRLDAALGPPVRLAADGLELSKGNAYLAPGGKHLLVAKRGRAQLLIKLDDGEPVNFVKPAADVLFKSAAECVGRNLLGVVLTGMGSDGAEGAVAIRRAGGRVIVQDEQSSVATSMPLAVIEAGAADKVLPLDKIPEEIIKFLEE